MDDAERTRKIENLKTRYERGDGLYGADAIKTLLEEIAILSERCLSIHEHCDPICPHHTHQGAP